MFLLIALPVLAGYAFRWHNARLLQQQLATIRAAGYPATLPELKEWSTSFSDTPGSVKTSEQTSPTTSSHGLTAAEGYQEAFDLIEQVSKSPEDRATHVRLDKLMGHNEFTPGRFSPEIQDLMKKRLLENAESLKKLHEAAQKPSGRFPFDMEKYTPDGLSYGRWVNQAAQLLQLEAWVAAENGDIDGTFEALLAGMSIDTPVRYEPIYDAYYNTFWCHRYVCYALRRALGFVSFSEAQLVRLGEALPKEMDAELCCRLLATERIFGLKVYDNGLNITEFKKLNRLENIIPGSSAVAGSIFGAVFFSASDRIRYLSGVEEAIALARKPFPETIPVMEHLERELLKKRTIPRASTAMRLRMLGAISSVAFDQAQLRCAHAALAVERYRLVAKQVPNSLDALVPAFLSEIPQDPYDGKPLRYRPEGSGYVVYSVSRNLQDDQGAEQRYDYRPNEADWVFRVKH
jgi:hypothetical protein